MLARRLMRTRHVVVAVLLLGAPVGAYGQTGPPQPAPLDWRALNTSELTIVGGVPDAMLRRADFVLARFRDAVGPILPAATRPPSKPTTVIIFPRRSQLAPFGMRESSGGYYEAGLFVGGMTSNYILLTATQGDFDVAYHEYVHLIVHQHVERAPAWFHEGLAEFFRTFAVEADGTGVIGTAPDGHVERLRAQSLLPLATLLEAGFDSPLYQEHDRASVLYAQSWLLVHYLVLGNQSRRSGQLMPLVAQLIAGATPEQASMAAFGVSLAALERELKAYLAGGVFPRQALPQPPARALASSPPVRAVPEAEAHTVLGEVLLTMGRLESAQDAFVAALAADPRFPRAHAGYGRVLAQQGRGEEARAHLALAAQAPDASWATLISYAAALYTLRPDHAVDSTGPDDAAIEQALRRAMALEPSRPVAFAHLARLLSLYSRRLLEAEQLISRAMRQSPDDEEFRLIYAAILVNGVRYASARPVLEKLTQARTPEIRRQAEQILSDVEALLSKIAGRTAEDAGLVPPTVRPHADGIPLFRELRQGEQRVAGLLSVIECVPNGFVIVTRTAGGTLRLAARSLQAVELFNYSRRSGPVNCGTGLQGTVVVVSFVPGSGKGSTDGRLTALEIAPEGYRPAGM